jgi:hypothetical protein
MNGPPVHLPKFPDSGRSHECSTIDAMAKWLTLEQGLKAAGLRIDSGATSVLSSKSAVVESRQTAPGQKCDIHAFKSVVSYRTFAGAVFQSDSACGVNLE